MTKNPDDLTTYNSTIQKYKLPEWSIIDTVLIHSQVINYIFYEYCGEQGIACDTSGNIIYTYNHTTSPFVMMGERFSQYYYARYTSTLNYTDNFIPLCVEMRTNNSTMPFLEPPSVSSTPDGTFQIVFPYRDLQALPGDPIWYLASLRGKIYDPTSISDNPKPDIAVNISHEIAKQSYSVQLSYPELASIPTASVFNLKGQLVNKLDFKKAENVYQANWQTKDVSSGIYFLKWNWEGQSGEKKLVVVK